MSPFIQQQQPVSISVHSPDRINCLTTRPLAHMVVPLPLFSSIAELLDSGFATIDLLKLYNIKVPANSALCYFDNFGTE
jgi:hypothetical protein